MDSLSTDDPELLSTHIAVLAQLVLRVPDAFESKSDVITKFLLKQVILANPPVDEVCPSVSVTRQNHSLPHSLTRCVIYLLAISSARSLSHLLTHGPLGHATHKHIAGRDEYGRRVG